MSLPHAHNQGGESVSPLKEAEWQLEREKQRLARMHKMKENMEHLVKEKVKKMSREE